MIAEIENAIIAALLAAGEDGLLPFSFARLESYPVDWDEYLKEKSGLLRAPAGWIVFAGWGNPANSDSDRPVLPATFGLVVMAENQRNELATRHGDPVDASKPGSYTLIEQSARFLSGKDFGLPIEAIEIGACRHVRPPEAMKERNISMMSVELRTGFIVTAIEPPVGEDDQFVTFHANWDIPVFGNVDAAPGTPGNQIPADATADATDNLTMEQ